ncbi:hypothetical protein FOA43_003784 [Brettanomyces nanus]|uniref:Uncharacterized protein n=1 Tax=Eeniella nana TaxID=13502 RepID=A0A875S816_EENNA|nr:uncharacterized protein FOA43_003784 [Brettanomyces nanus]QPG76395.1 hypothetical protein FOA43_003784 [Brettanomyces nanus]
MGKLVVNLSKLATILQQENAPKSLRVIAQVYKYDVSSGILTIVDIPTSHLANNRESKLPECLWKVDLQYVLPTIKLNQSALFHSGVIVNIDAIYKAGFKDTLIAFNLYELKEPELVLSNLQQLQQFESI